MTSSRRLLAGGIAASWSIWVEATAQQIAYAKQMVGFLRACAGAFRQALTRRGAVDWGDVLDIATEAGANAVPIVLLTGFLMGVIIAFEIGLVAQKFGAVIFVVDGVGIAMLRELGVLMTAIVFAGRTGAAFAAQIGTQKVNEEVNAIATFGLDPVHFLVLPRLLAAMLVLPLLTVLADLIGLFGGALVMVTFDVGFLQFYNQLLGAVTAGDFMLGIVKAAVFGLMIAAVGCHRGLDDRRRCDLGRPLGHERRRHQHRADRRDRWPVRRLHELSAHDDADASELGQRSSCA